MFFKVSQNFNLTKFQDLFLNPIKKVNILNFKKIDFERGKKFHKFVLELSKNAKLIPSLIFKKIDHKHKKNINNLLYQMGLMQFDYLDLANQNQHISDSIKLVSSANVPLPYVENSSFKIFKSYIGSQQHMAIIINPKKIKTTTNLRIHSACFTGDIFHSLKCDCGEQLDLAMEKIAKEGKGIIVYSRQEGRGIGLVNKLKAYNLQDEGLDTVEANVALGFDAEMRDYKNAAKILKNLGVEKITIMTNNPSKIEDLTKEGYNVKQTKHLPEPNKENKDYLKTKAEKMRHDISFD